MEDFEKLLGFPTVQLPDTAVSVESTIRFLIGHLVVGGFVAVGDSERVVHSLFEREHLGSTALGAGVALPHTSTSVNAIVGIIGRSRVGIPWEAPDGLPVYRVGLVLAPDGRQRVLEQLARALREG